MTTPYELERQDGGSGRFVCPAHPATMLLDQATGAGIVPSALCPVCEPLQCVDVVRQLYVKR